MANTAFLFHVSGKLKFITIVAGVSMDLIFLSYIETDLGMAQCMLTTLNMVIWHQTHRPGQHFIPFLGRKTSPNILYNTDASA